MCGHAFWLAFMFALEERGVIEKNKQTICPEAFFVPLQLLIGQDTVGAYFPLNRSSGISFYPFYSVIALVFIGSFWIGAL